MKKKALLNLIITTVLFFSAILLNHSVAETTPDPVPFGIAVTPPESGNIIESILLASIATDIIAIPSLWFNVFSGEINTCQDMVPLIQISQNLGLQVVVRFEAVVLGIPAVPPYLGESSFGNPDVVSAYLEQIACFAELGLDYLVLGPEINFAYRLNRSEFDLYAVLYTQAYDLMKQLSPGTRVGVSYHFLSMLSFDEWEAVDLLGPQDYVGFTKYFAISLDRFLKYPGPSHLPDDFFKPIRDHFPDKPIVFTEYAWGTFYSPIGEQLQAEFLLHTPRLMSSVQPELVMWASLYDLQEFGEVLEAIDYVGLWTKNAEPTPKPAWIYLRNIFAEGWFEPSVTVP